MFKYQWTTVHGRQMYACFYDGWKRLNYCKAATYECSQNVSGEYKVCRYYLISYGTPIAHVVVWPERNSTKTAFVTITINKDNWRCSTTTIHQLSRWLSYLHLFRNIPFELTYQYLKSVVYSNGFLGFNSETFCDYDVQVRALSHGYFVDEFNVAVPPYVTDYIPTLY